jgi:hypothetical protein
MYALIHNSQLLLGPIGWNYRMINSDLEEELELDYRVTINDWQSVPIKVNEETYILPVKQVIPDHDPKYYNVGNFTWEREYSDLTKSCSSDPNSFEPSIEIQDVVLNEYCQMICTIPSLSPYPGLKINIKNLQFDTSEGVVSINDAEYVVSSFDGDTFVILPEELSPDIYNPLINRSTYIPGASVENTVTLTSAVFTYAIHEKTLDEVKHVRRQEVAPYRREKENQIITISVDGTDVEILTSREERAIIATKLASSLGTYNYKFSNTWLEVSQQQLQDIMTQIDQKVQEAYDWEFAKLAEIDACETLDEVYDVVVRELPPEPEDPRFPSLPVI